MLRRPAKFKSKSKRTRSDLAKVPEVPEVSAVDESKCFVARLFDHGLDHVLEAIFCMVSPRDLDSCKLVCKRWNAFLKVNVWGSPRCRSIIMPKWEKKLRWNWEFAEPGMTHRFPLPEDFAHYRDVALVADSREVVAGLGNGLIFVWNRITMGRVLIDYEVRRHCPLDSPAPVLALHEDVLAAVFFTKDDDAKVVLYCREENYRDFSETGVPESRDQIPFKAVFVGNRLAVGFKNQVIVYVMEKEKLQESFRVREMADGSGIRDLAASKDGRLLVAFGNSNSRVAVFKADAGGIMERDANLNRDCQCVAPAPEGWLAGEDGLLVAGQMGPVVLLNKNWTTGQNSTYLHMSSFARPVQEMKVSGDVVAVSTFLNGNNRNNSNSAVRRKRVLHLRKSEAKITVYSRNQEGKCGLKREVTSYSASPSKAKGPAFVLERDAVVRLADDGNEIVVQSFWHVDVAATKKKMKAKKDKEREASRYMPRWRI